MNQTSYGSPRVGGDILTYCTRCKMELAHVVVSMVDRKPFKVQCKTCRSEHRFRHAPSPTMATKKRSVSAAPKTTIRVAELWEKKLAEASGEPRGYTITEPYRVGDVVKHTQFGLGMVEEVRGNGRMRVLFRDEERLLVCGSQPSSPK